MASSATNSQAMLAPIRNGISATVTAWSRFVTIITRRRSQRSTNTPATSPTSTVGIALAISVAPTRKAEPVCW